MAGALAAGLTAWYLHFSPYHAMCKSCGQRGVGPVFHHIDLACHALAMSLIEHAQTQGVDMGDGCGALLLPASWKASLRQRLGPFAPISSLELLLGRDRAACVFALVSDYEAAGHGFAFYELAPSAAVAVDAWQRVPQASVVH
eukprot:438339-Amphidinium_carterae.1